MTDEEREKLLDYNEQLCNAYLQTDDETLLPKILATELILFPTMKPATDEEIATMFD